MMGSLQVACFLGSRRLEKVKGMAFMKKRMFWKISLTIICLAATPLLAQQFLETRIVELDTQGKYAEALALCEKNIDLSIAAYFAGEYTYHGRKGHDVNLPAGEYDAFTQRSIDKE